LQDRPFSRINRNRIEHLRELSGTFMRLDDPVRPFDCVSNLASICMLNDKLWWQREFPLLQIAFHLNPTVV